ncbi:rhodanese-like domain-containing protein [Flocculibacter collagenilyticus]|uniref:rhodanese-like domain-containing protein n=1 Tax=Flocculibacter collagenilyticus TaxID=2744479 RepID=UPI0018F6669E|nr:rhodanese-like domain-containing protein [Flocculibacter collagenilyticus]
MNTLRTINMFLAILIIVCISTAAYAGYTGKQPLIQPEVLHQKIIDNKLDDIVILDVRTAKEFAEGHVPNAINISHDELPLNLSQLKTLQDKTIVVYCRSGRRAGIAEDILSEQGFNHIQHLAGDMKGWRAAKLPIEKPANESK